MTESFASAASVVNDVVHDLDNQVPVDVSGKPVLPAEETEEEVAEEPPAVPPPVCDQTAIPLPVIVR